MAISLSESILNKIGRLIHCRISLEYWKIKSIFRSYLSFAKYIIIPGYRITAFTCAPKTSAAQWNFTAVWKSYTQAVHLPRSPYIPAGCAIISSHWNSGRNMCVCTQNAHLDRFDSWCWLAYERPHSLICSESLEIWLPNRTVTCVESSRTRAHDLLRCVHLPLDPFFFFFFQYSNVYSYGYWKLRFRWKVSSLCRACVRDRIGFHGKELNVRSKLKGKWSQK